MNPQVARTLIVGLAAVQDRARKHRAILHNQPITDDQDWPFTSPDALKQDDRISWSEVMLQRALVDANLIPVDEEIEEIVDIEADPLRKQPAYLCVTTPVRIIEIPYN